MFMNYECNGKNIFMWRKMEFSIPRGDREISYLWDMLNCK